VRQRAELPAERPWGPSTRQLRLRHTPRAAARLVKPVARRWRSPRGDAPTLEAWEGEICRIKPRLWRRKVTNGASYRSVALQKGGCGCNVALEVEGTSRILVGDEPAIGAWKPSHHGPRDESLKSNTVSRNPAQAE